MVPVDEVAASFILCPGGLVAVSSMYRRSSVCLTDKVAHQPGSVLAQYLGGDFMRS